MKYKSYKEVKDEAQKKYSKLMDACNLFWAFSNEQFDEGRKKYPADKYTSIGAGGFMPSNKVNDFTQGMQAIEKWEKLAQKQVKKEEAILYELNNYECFYTGDIADAMPRLEDLGYTIDEVKAVYHDNREFALN